LAAREIAKVNLHRICSLSGAACIEDSKGSPLITIPFIRQEHVVRLEPEVDVLRKDDSDPVPIPEKILILHYLLTARGDSLKRNWITFREIPEGVFYYSAFLKRARDPLVRTFGPEPQRLLRCGAQIGAEPDQLGDVSITLKALPRIPVTVVLWRGDDELPPEGSILFDESVASYLPTEDIAVLSGMVVYRLIRVSQSLSRN
jgi:hypothetical protein